MHSPRRRNPLFLASLALAALPISLLAAAGCGSSVNPGDGDGEGGGAGGPGEEIPPECRVEAEPGLTYGVTFNFENGGDSPVYLWEDCNLRYEISACADGYSEPLAVHASCSLECTNAPSQGCIACAPCLQSAEVVQPQETVPVGWSGKHFRFGTSSAGCSCHDTFTAPAARYRLRIPVFASAEDAEANVSPRWVSVDFELGTRNVVVPVPLAP
ncbi:hypothetical protein [Chondromyces crocatus]|uniref:Lipoprotein n=1 Tax=Chondromyces crocatus TaxID=52 RepID=A0A0K1EPE6_CHOCO|nr:hypothetical protein [Chondromyces crocatus]AKT42721.1 uncharacterized protein CMC5_069480 [Chondromyces crocatus]